MMNNYFRLSLVIITLQLLMACSQQPDSSNQQVDISQVDTDVAQQNSQESSVELVEIKLIDAQDDKRGYCVDLFDHLTGAQPIAGLQAHNCFLYFGEGPTPDQGFDLAVFNQTGQLKLAHFERCMEVHNPQPGPAGSFVALESCTGSPVQTFERSAAGTIKPMANPAICLTIGDMTVPGGPRVVPDGLNFIFPPENNESLHVIRRLTFETCSNEMAVRQQWEFRSGEYSPDESAIKNRFN